MEQQHRFTVKMLAGMVLGIVLGLLMQVLPWPSVSAFLGQTLFASLGEIFIRLMKMLVVPIVFFSLVCGVCNIGSGKGLGKMAVKTIVLYVLTTAIAITLAIVVANIFQVGHGMAMPNVNYDPAGGVPSFWQVLVNIFPANPFEALVYGNMLQIIVLAVLLGLAMVAVGKKAENVFLLFRSANDIIMRLVLMVMSVAPYGVFCILFSMFAKMHIHDVLYLLGYFFVVVLVLVLQLFAIYGGLLSFSGRGSITTFLQKIYPAMMFAFSTSSSSASIPVTLDTVEKRLGIRNRIAAFVIPMGATINMDGTAIMQGVATVFLAHVYQIHLGVVGYLTVIGMATVSSIGTAGVPGVGLFTLTMVLQQVGIPVDGIALILGVDRILDMMRTTLNVAGDAMVATLVDDKK